MVTDPIADSLIRIKNGYLSRKKTVELPRSKMVAALSGILTKEGYVENVKEEGFKLIVTLKYDKNTPVLSDVAKISKPGLRVYIGHDKIPTVLSGRGISIVSTPQGLMTGKEAKNKGIGGELICKVW